MIVFKKIIPLQRHLATLRAKDLSIGFAPTMGALHRGHMSLMATSSSQCDVTVCSIFVNPTQFNEKSDLDKYPITIQSDLNMLLAEGVDIVFLPNAQEIYPRGDHYEMPYDLGPVAEVLEGAKRPGHFEGVVQVVDRLLEIVQPSALFMGQKDFQQFSIIQRMLDLNGKSTELVVCPIIREADGLAMSSRNVRLSNQDREDALSLSAALNFINKHKEELSISDLKENALGMLDNPNITVEYLTIVNGSTLQNIDEIDSSSYAVALVAAWVGEVRLIDNIILVERRH